MKTTLMTLAVASACAFSQTVFAQEAEEEIAAEEEKVSAGEEKCSAECPAYYLKPRSAWNYAMPEFGDIGKSVRAEAGGEAVQVELFRRPDWRPETGYNAERTPWVPAPKAAAGPAELKTLVPMARTRLRISVFPIAE
mgnify:CR=1 FL=1